MKRKEKDAILKHTKTLTDEELREEYYDATYNSLGSLTDDMYEYGYDMRDIEEREQYEKFLGEKADVLYALCKERGIKLWEK